MTEIEHYGSPAAVEAAITDAARKAFAASPALRVDERIRLEYFNRFLSRIFSDDQDSDWLLKGGTSMLARVAAARATIDVDLFRRSRSLDAALEDLKRLAAVDLGDWFRFQYAGHTDSAAGDQQAYAEGYQVNFDVYIGAKKKGSFHVDLVINVTTTDDPELAASANALDLPRLRSTPYRLYPTVDQTADKVCATIALYNGKPSSREKDLVDLVLIAATQNLDADKLLRALTAEAKVRDLALPMTFELPSNWGSRYTKLASPIPSTAPYQTIHAAKELMSRFLDPVLAGTVAGMRWDHNRLDWV